MSAETIFASVSVWPWRRRKFFREMGCEQVLLNGLAAGKVHARKSTSMADNSAVYYDARDVLALIEQMPEVTK